MSRKKKLNKLRKEFFKKEESINNLLRAQRDSMNEKMFSENNDTLLIKSIAKRVADNEYQMELYRIEQSQQLKKLCNKETIEKIPGTGKRNKRLFSA